MDLIDKIKADIEQKRKEITELEIALEVCQRLVGKKKEKEEEKPLFTIRKTGKAGGSSPKKRVVSIPEARPVILKLLESHGTLTSGEVTRLTGFPSKTVYNTMYALKVSGRVEKDGSAFRLRGKETPQEEPDEPEIIEPPLAVTTEETEDAVA